MEIDNYIKLYVESIKENNETKIKLEKMHSALNEVCYLLQRYVNDPELCCPKYWIERHEVYK